MSRAADALVALVALEHLAFMVLEMFFWRRPLGLRIFRQSQAAADSSAALAANQGLYNGFLAAGLVWGLCAGPAGLAIRTYFLGCVVVAGAFAAVTVSPRILLVQGVPAMLALAASWSDRL